jgi:hypothetical protein
LTTEMVFLHVDLSTLSAILNNIGLGGTLNSCRGLAMQLRDPCITNRLRQGSMMSRVAVAVLTRSCLL